MWCGINQFLFSTYTFSIAWIFDFSIAWFIVWFFLIFYIYIYICKVFLRIWAAPVSAIFCISSRFGLPGTCYRCFPVPFLIISNATITTKIVKVFICHSFSTSISRSLYLDSFSNSATETFLSEGIYKSISLQVFSFLSLTVMSGLFALIFLSVYMLQSHKMVTLSVSVTVSGWCSYQLSAGWAP